MKKPYRNAAKTNKAIRESYIELLGEKKRMSLITVTEIAKRADISKSTFYNHYSDIFEIEEELENELLSQIFETIDKIEASNSFGYEDFIRQTATFIKANESIYKSLVHSPDLYFFVSKLKAQIYKKIQKDSVSIPFSQNEGKRAVQIRIIINSCIDTTIDYLKGSFNVSADELAEILIEFLDKLAQKQGLSLKF